MVFFLLLLVVGESQFISLSNRLNKAYYAQVGAGNPSQDFSVPISSYSPVNVNSSLIYRSLAQVCAKMEGISTP